MDRRKFFGRFGSGLAGGSAAVLMPEKATAHPALTDTIYNVREFGAIGNGVVLDTDAIQQAIDTCADNGGGTVYLSGGTFLSGTIFLKSNVTLYLESGAVLQGSPELKHYPVTVQEFRSYTDNYTDKSLIYAERAENIAIAGRGILDGEGTAFSGPYKVRPYMIRIIECTNITVRDVTIRNSPMWVQHYLACDNVNIDGITVHSRRLHVNNDGMDIDCCHKVRIANCEINSGDDAIVLKATSDRKCRDVTVTNCVLSSATNAFKLGTESNGGFENIVFSNSTIYDSRHGLALEEVDGAVFDRVTISNIIMNQVSISIFIRLGNRARPYQSVGTAGTYTIPEDMERPGIGSLRNVYISNVQARDVSDFGCSITGLPGHPVENITLENIRILFEGGGTTEDAGRTVPELPEHYPSARMFGMLPAYGFFCRHARNLNFHHVEIGFVNEEKRPALICEDVETLRVEDFSAEISSDAHATLWLKQVREAFVTRNSPKQSETTFLRLDGEQTRQISVQGNDFSQVETILVRGGEVSEEAVYPEGNRI